MNVIPKGKLDQVQFAESHLAPFAVNAVAIGTTAAAVSDLSAKTVAARAAFNAQQAAQLAAMAATANYELAVRAMTAAAADIVKQVKAKAASTGDAVYTLAQIPAPATPGPLGALAKPGRFAVAPAQDGAVELSWKCTQPAGASGTMYQVYRRVGAGEFAFVGATGAKRFVDATLPAGSASVTYQVQAVRSTSVGPVARFNVNFGVAGNGVTASAVGTTPARVAA